MFQPQRVGFAEGRAEEDPEAEQGQRGDEEESGSIDEHHATLLPSLRIAPDESSMVYRRGRSPIVCQGESNFTNVKIRMR